MKTFIDKVVAIQEYNKCQCGEWRERIPGLLSGISTCLREQAHYPTLADTID